MDGNPYVPEKKKTKETNPFQGYNKQYTPVIHTEKKKNVNPLSLSVTIWTENKAFHNFISEHEFYNYKSSL
jgi:hypothetical protein